MSDNRALRSTAWAFGAECAAKLIVPISNMILARILAPEAFGIVVTVNMVISFAEMITSSGFQKYIIQKEFETEKKINKAASVAFWSNFLLAMTALVVISVFNKSIAAFVGSEGYGTSIIVACIALPLTSLSGIYEGLYKRKFNFQTLFVIRVAVCLMPIMVTIPLALMGFGHWALIIGTLAGHVLRNIIFLVYKRTWLPSFYFSIAELKEMFSFGIWTLLESIVAWLITWVDVFLVTNAFDTYYTGLYKNAQSTVTSILSIITAATQPVLFSLLSRLQNDRNEFNKTFIGYVKYTSVFMIPMGVGLFAYSDVVTQILLGDAWMEAADFVGYWGLATAFNCLFSELNREAYRAINKPRVSFFVMLSHLAFIVPVCIIALPLGFDRFIVIRSLAYLEVIIPSVLCVKYVLKASLRKYFSGLLVPVGCSALMLCVARLMSVYIGGDLIAKLLQILICALVYFTLLSMFKEYREIEKSILRKGIARFARK